MVKAVRVHKVGGADVLTYEDVMLSEPAAGEVRVRNRAIGVNFIDIYHRTGLYPVPLPFIPGGEAAGDVAAIGPGVKGFKTGDRVTYVAGFGGYAEERNVPASLLLKLPEAISYKTAAGMMLKGLTAQYLLRQTWRIEPDEICLVHAAAGGVGLILCQWAKHLGAHVIGTVGDKAKAKLARGNGADHVILYREEDFVARVKEITDGDLCDVVYDGVGKDTFPASLDCIRPLGTFVSFGNASGAIPAFNLGLLSQKGSLFATRPTLNTYTSLPGNLKRMAKDLFAVVESGAVKIAVSKTYKLKDVQDAHRDLEGRKTTGALILTP
jgi:NADPH2:quinone reductase